MRLWDIFWLRALPNGLAILGVCHQKATICTALHVSHWASVASLAFHTKSMEMSFKNDMLPKERPKDGQKMPNDFQNMRSNMHVEI